MSRQHTYASFWSAQLRLDRMLSDPKLRCVVLEESTQDLVDKIREESRSALALVAGIVTGGANESRAT